MSSITTSALDTPAGRSIEQTCDDLALAVLAVVSVVAGLTFKDYGLGWDDYTHAEYADLLLKMFGSGYLQEITGLIVSTSNREPTIFSTSLGAGYFLFRNDTDRFIKAIVPNVETHVRIPLNNRDPNGCIYVQDQVNLTSSIHFRFDRVTVTPAFAVPLVGPKPWNYEGILWVNMRF